ncbi:M14 family zinc carboxypeptidase [Sphingobacterium sp.]|uniref:M14 family zinc carboxypeptidase n=1 Tax=Sphingobacterium sp. TaxID=341027 RepID=UPI0028A140E5|nr:M14 family zinc carboxypeptidase [Sphingobacterium sp.]
MRATITIWSVFLILTLNNVFGQQIPFERDPEHNTTVTYDELQNYYQELLKDEKQAKIIDLGKTDIGKPLQLIVLSKDADFDPQSIKRKGKAVLFMNNGIHPGEPEGIDASMMFVRDLLKQNKLSSEVVVCMIPVYNIAGMINRGTTRANQNGPNAYGFRGSGQNYDLNRDFIKADTRNAMLFNEVFSTWDPNVFFDTHTSNGADYQHIMTLIATHPDKLHPKLGGYMKARFTNKLYQEMEKKGYPMVPYVDSKGETPETGLVSFLDGARYSTGYAALHHTIGYMPETHMWKPYKERVESTYALMGILHENLKKEAKDLVKLRRQIKQELVHQKEFPIQWELDTTKIEQIPFLGFKSGHKISEVSGQQRLFYDREKPFSSSIPHYYSYKETLRIEKPKAYIVPQAYEKVIQLLKANRVDMQQLEQDSIIDAQMYYIRDYRTSNRPYEGHYPHSAVTLEVVNKKQAYFKGDWIIPTDQESIRYIVETLEPQATDSFFNWNFFDAILSQKEYFSGYIFEDYAAEMLRKDKDLKRSFENAKSKDGKLKESAAAQLQWLYQRSPFYEKTFNLYPVARIVD